MEPRNILFVVVVFTLACSVGDRGLAVSPTAEPRPTTGEPPVAEPPTREPPPKAPEPAAPPPAAVDAAVVDAAAAPGPDTDPPVEPDAGPAIAAGADATSTDVAGPVLDAPGPVAVDCPGDPTLSLCLRFEGRVVDESPHAQHPSASGVRYSAGPSGMAAVVDQGSDIRLADSPLLDAPGITVEAWLAPSALPPPNQRRGILDSPGQYGMFLLPPATVMCIAGQAQAEARDVLRVGRWISAACTFDARNVAVWVEGKKMAEVPSTGVNQGGTRGLTVGFNNPSGENFDGLLDNVRLWRRVRTSAELSAAALAF
jgi:hypothetical protein